MKVECVKGEIARSTAEDLEAERARSRSLSDDIDRLKRALLETPKVYYIAEHNKSHSLIQS